MMRRKLDQDDDLPVTLHLHHEAKPDEEKAGAVLVSETGDKDHAFWLPKSQIEFTQPKLDTIEAVVPEWLAKEKGLI